MLLARVGKDKLPFNDDETKPALLSIRKIITKDIAKKCKAPR